LQDESCLRIAVFLLVKKNAEDKGRSTPRQRFLYNIAFTPLPAYGLFLPGECSRVRTNHRIPRQLA